MSRWTRTCSTETRSTRKYWTKTCPTKALVGVCLGSLIAAFMHTEAMAELRIRKNYRLLTLQQRQDFVDAIKNVKAHAEVGIEGACNYTNTYDKYVCWHKECG